MDNGLVRSSSFESSSNFSKRLENMVFIELLRRSLRLQKDLFYYRTRNDKEIDFLCRRNNRVCRLIQVYYDISATKTLKQEISALCEAAAELKCEDLFIIDWNDEVWLKRRDML